jgi:hypothetical protein
VAHTLARCPIAAQIPWSEVLEIVRRHNQRYEAQRVKDRRWERNGWCQRCGRPAAQNRSLCAEHLRDLATRSRRWYARKRGTEKRMNEAEKLQALRDLPAGVRRDLIDWLERCVRKFRSGDGPLPYHADGGRAEACEKLIAWLECL